MNDLFEFYENADLPPEIVLDEVTYIGNVRLFVNAHLTLIKANIKSEDLIKPYVERLRRLKEILTQKGLPVEPAE